MRVDNMLDIFYQKERVYEILNKQKVVYKYNDNRPTYLDKDLWNSRITWGFQTDYDIYDAWKIHKHFYPNDSGLISLQYKIFNLKSVDQIKFVTLMDFLNAEGNDVSLTYPIYDYDTWEIIEQRNIPTNLNEEGDIFFGIKTKYDETIEDTITTLYIVTMGTHIFLPNDLSYFFCDNLSVAYSGFSYIQKIDFNNIVTIENPEDTVNLKSICSNCIALSTINLEQLGIQKIDPDLEKSFNNCYRLTDLSFLKSIDTCYVRNMESTFSLCMSLTELDMSKFNFSQAENLNDTFYNVCSQGPYYVPHEFNFIINLSALFQQYNGKLEGTFRECNLNSVTATLDSSIINKLGKGCFFGASMHNITLNFDNRHFTPENTPYNNTRQGCFQQAGLKEISLKNIQANSLSILFESSRFLEQVSADKIYLNNANINNIDLYNLPNFFAKELLDLSYIRFNNIYYSGYEIDNHPWYTGFYSAQVFSNLIFNVAGELNLTGYNFKFPNEVLSNRLIEPASAPAITLISMVEATGFVPPGYANEIYCGFEKSNWYRTVPTNPRLKKLNLSYTNISSVYLGQIEAWHWEEYAIFPGEYYMKIDRVSESYLEEIILSHNSSTNLYICGGQQDENSLKSIDLSYNTLNYMPKINEFILDWSWSKDTFSSLKSLNLSNTTFNNTNFSLGRDYPGYPQLETLNITNLNFINKPNLSFELRNIPKLEQINLNDINWSNITNVNEISFLGCSSLTSLNLSPIPSLNVTNGNTMFTDCTNLTTINFGNLNFDNCNTGGYRTFENCKSLTQLDLSSFNFNGFRDCSYMFAGCKNLTQIILPLMNNITNMTCMFDECEKLTSVNINNINTSNVTNMSYLFRGCKAITTNTMANIISYLVINNVTNLSGMFAKCTGLTTIDISTFNTDKVTSIGSLFSQCENLTSINLNNINTSEVKNMSSVFYLCKNLTSIDVTGFNTSKVENMGSMFQGCEKLISINVSNFNTNKVKNMNQMFYDCKKLISIDVSNFNTESLGSIKPYQYSSSIENGCYYMFGNCENLNSISLFDLNVSSERFSNETGIDLRYMFNNCKSLTNINLKHFYYTYNETWDEYFTRHYYYGIRIEGMFESCSNLTTINTYTNRYDELSEEQHYIFSGCNKLVGGNGTVYNSNHTDNTYARVDHGIGVYPGYFTLIQEPA